MYKIKWGRSSDEFHTTFVVCPNVYATFELYFILKNSSMDNSCKPINIIVTNLDGFEVDMSKGLLNAASYGTHSCR